jgi:vanillate O-demethylase ferredoxin subunit
VRQYSLCGDPYDDSIYKVAVKREDDGRGASRWIHENLKIDTVVSVSAPRNNFPLAEGVERHIFIAGGIGITPFIAMAKQLARSKTPFELHYCARSPAAAPFLTELYELCGSEALHVYFSKQNGRRIDIQAILSSATDKTHIYCCGPQRLTEAVRGAAGEKFGERFHSEIFKATLDENFNPEPFDIKLASTGEVLRVPANKSALDVLRAHGLALPASCELGVCGSCVCSYTDGMVIHRDVVLNITARQERMMLCVSRARVSVTLDL